MLSAFWFAFGRLAGLTRNRLGISRATVLFRLGVGVFWVVSPSGQAEIQFDVFPGHDGLIRQGAWFPVVCEVLNDGPSFEARIEIQADRFNRDQVRQVTIELPTNTRKRFTIPCFANSTQSAITAILRDAKGRVVAEQALTPSDNIMRESFMLGSISRQFVTAPQFPELGPGISRWNRLHVARFMVNQFPDNPLALESLNALYLNTEKALELNAGQARAIAAWLAGGGHLIVGVESGMDVNALAWLRRMMPARLDSVREVAARDVFHNWLNPAYAPATPTLVRRRGDRQSIREERPASSGPQIQLQGTIRGDPNVNAPNPFGNLIPDPAFEAATLVTAQGRLRETAQLLLRAGDAALISALPQGRGQVTLLHFSPEREPFKSWGQYPWFWARICGVPPADLIANPSGPGYASGNGLDGVFGAMIDSRQVRKLPVVWLIVLLVVYLLVIGPCDRYWLKKINRPVLTWITFPIYVVGFSLLIYYIGYRLRAGETEWNELQVVDVIEQPTETAYRGRSFISLYSPVNASYQVAGAQTHATLRGEFVGVWMGDQSGGQVTVQQKDPGFEASIRVPVWTSQLFVSDWYQDSAETPLQVNWEQSGGPLKFTLTNNLADRPLRSVTLIHRGQVYELDAIDPQATRNCTPEMLTGITLTDYIRLHTSSFETAVAARRQSLGDTSRGWLNEAPVQSIAASFIGALGAQDSGINPRYAGGGPGRQFVTTPEFDLSALEKRGYAIVLAWDAGHAAASASNRFEPKRKQQDTLYRWALPVGF